MKYYFFLSKSYLIQINPRQNLVLEERSLVRLQGIDVLNTGERIKSWLIQTDPTKIKFKNNTQRLFDIVSCVTGLEQNNILSINFVGLGRLMIKFNKEVLFILYY